MMAAIMTWESTTEAQLIVAHRGASYDAPENTLSAFRLAWEQGADAIEGDFFLTKDEQIVCIHDAKTKRTSGIEMDVASFTLAELRQLDVGRWKDARWAGERIPTLAEVLAVVPAGKKIYIEIKCGPEIVPHLPAVLKQSGLKPEQMVIISFDDKVIAETVRQLPELKSHWLAGFKQNATTQAFEPSTDAILETLAKIHAHGLDVQANPSVVNAEFVKRLRGRQLEFHVWTVNKPDDAKLFWELGVDSITTDRPRFLQDALQAQ
jgi:glycerophosphoryl diester phosphodiesterase